MKQELNRFSCGNCGVAKPAKLGKVSEDAPGYTSFICNTCRVDEVAHDAMFKFWEVVAQSYPNIKTGDLPIAYVGKFMMMADTIVNEWVAINEEEN